MVPQLDSAQWLYRQIQSVSQPGRIARPFERPFQFQSDLSNPPDCTGSELAASLMACGLQLSYYHDNSNLTQSFIVRVIE